jgi:hypothetical protein
MRIAKRYLFTLNHDMAQSGLGGNPYNVTEALSRNAVGLRDVTESLTKWGLEKCVLSGFLKGEF